MVRRLDSRLRTLATASVGVPLVSATSCDFDPYPHGCLRAGQIADTTQNALPGERIARPPRSSGCRGRPCAALRTTGTAHHLEVLPRSVCGRQNTSDACRAHRIRHTLRIPSNGHASYGRSSARSRGLLAHVEGGQAFPPRETSATRRSRRMRNSRVSIDPISLFVGASAVVLCDVDALAVLGVIRVAVAVIAGALHRSECGNLLQRGQQ